MRLKRFFKKHRLLVNDVTDQKYYIKEKIRHTNYLILTNAADGKDQYVARRFDIDQEAQCLKYKKLFIQNPTKIWMDSPVVGIHDFFSCDDSIYVVLNLPQLQYPALKTHFPEIRETIERLADAINSLHKEGICHHQLTIYSLISDGSDRDQYLVNIVVDYNYLGQDGDHRLYLPQKIYPFLHPTIIVNCFQSTSTSEAPKFDIYSLAVIAYQLLMGLDHFQTVSDNIIKIYEKTEKLIKVKSTNVYKPQFKYPPDRKIRDCFKWPELEKKTCEDMVKVIKKALKLEYLQVGSFTEDDKTFLYEFGKALEKSVEKNAEETRFGDIRRGNKIARRIALGLLLFTFLTFAFNYIIPLVKGFSNGDATYAPMSFQTSTLTSVVPTVISPSPTSTILPSITQPTPTPSSSPTTATPTSTIRPTIVRPTATSQPPLPDSPWADVEIIAGENFDELTPRIIYPDEQSSESGNIWDMMFFSHPSTGNYLVTGSTDRRVILWHISNGDGEKLDFKTSHNVSHSLILSNDQQLLASADRRSPLYLWQVEDILEGNQGVEEIHLPAQNIRGEYQISAFDFSSNGDLIYIGTSTGILYVFDTQETSMPTSTENLEEYFEISTTTPLAIKSIDTTADGQFIAIAYADNILLRNSQNEDTKLVFPIDEDNKTSQSIQKLAFTPDSRYLVAGSTDGSIAIWDLYNLGRQPIHIKKVHANGAVLDFAIAPSDNAIFSVGLWDSSVQMLNVDYENFDFDEEDKHEIDVPGSPRLIEIDPSQTLLAVSDQKSIIFLGIPQSPCRITIPERGSTANIRDEPRNGSTVKGTLTVGETAWGEAKTATGWIQIFEDRWVASRLVTEVDEPCIDRLPIVEAD